MKGKKQKEPVGFNPAEIFAALALLEKERGIPQSFMMEKIVQALTTAYKRDHADVENVIVDVDEAHQNLKMFVQKNVVEEEDYVDPANEMPIEEAKRLSAKYEVGDIVNIPVDTVEFGRIAAGNGKQVIIQGLREAERGQVYDEFNSKQHEILTGVVTRVDPRNGNVSLRIGTGTDSTEALLMAGEQVPGEDLTEGMHVKVYVVEVRRSTRGPQVLISRTHPGLVKRLFELEVPEIYDGTVEVKSIAREAGSRTKMAVWSNDENVDPIGACVGPKGQRVGSIVEELRGEKIDIVKYSEDPAQFRLGEGELEPQAVTGLGEVLAPAAGALRRVGGQQQHPGVPGAGHGLYRLLAHGQPAAPQAETQQGQNVKPVHPHLAVLPPWRRRPPAGWRCQRPVPGPGFSGPSAGRPRRGTHRRPARASCRRSPGTRCRPGP